MSSRAWCWPRSKKRLRTGVKAQIRGGNRLMDLGIAGKVAVVTASSAGLGAAVARALAAEGVKLVLFARSAEKLQALADEIEHAHNIPVLAVAGDLRLKEDVE